MKKALVGVCVFCALALAGVTAKAGLERTNTVNVTAEIMETLELSVVNDTIACGQLAWSKTTGLFPTVCANNMAATWGATAPYARFTVASNSVFDAGLGANIAASALAADVDMQPSGASPPVSDGWKIGVEVVKFTADAPSAYDPGVALFPGGTAVQVGVRAKTSGTFIDLDDGDYAGTYAGTTTLVVSHN